MKTLFVALLLSATIYGQSCSVRGCVLSYDSKLKTMVLTIPKSLIVVSNAKNEIEVSISKSFSLSINGKETNYVFLFKGFKVKDLCGLTYESNNNVMFKEDDNQYVYTFPKIGSNEYILKVSTLQETKRVNQQSNSLIIK